MKAIAHWEVDLQDGPRSIYNTPYETELDLAAGGVGIGSDRRSGILAKHATFERFCSSK
jgi:hypothetical protein